MPNLFNLVTEFSGQRNNLSIPRVYIKLCGGDFLMASVLSQLVFWSSKSQREDGFFWKSYEDLAQELCEDAISVEQIRYAVKKLRTLLSDCLFVEVKRANGVPTNHYRFDQFIFMARLNQLSQHSAKALSSNVLSQNGKIPTSKQEIYQFKMGNLPHSRNGKIPVSITDPNHIQPTDLPPNPQGEIADVEQAVNYSQDFATTSGISKKREARVDCSRIAEIYNECVEETAVPLPKVRNPHNLTNVRRRAINAVANYFFKEWASVSEKSFRDYFMDFIEQAKQRPDQFYFGGGSRGWKADFDYIVSVRVVTKTLEYRL